jgi:uncharacterized membrane protein YgcG
MNDDSLEPDLRSRLRAELDRVQPLHSTPRYASADPRPVAWRFAPAVLVASVISMLVLTAYVATGSPNPADWGHDVVTIIQSSSTTPTPTAKPTIRPAPTQTPAQPKPTQKPAEHESPEPSDDHSGEDHSGSDSSGHGGGGGGSDGGGDDREGSSSDSD